MAQKVQPCGAACTVPVLHEADGIRQCVLQQVRGTLLTASQCATYDDTKRLWMRYTGWRDGLGTHIGTSMITGAHPCPPSAVPACCFQVLVSTRLVFFCFTS